MRSTRFATAVAGAILLAVCATTAALGSTAKTVTISVVSLIPGSTPAAFQQFNQQVAEFEKGNPGIKIKPVQYQWTGPTFAAKLAAGTLPTVFTVPFTLSPNQHTYTGWAMTTTQLLAGRVVAQSPSAGINVHPGSLVELSVALWP